MSQGFSLERPGLLAAGWIERTYSLFNNCDIRHCSKLSQWCHSGKCCTLARTPQLICAFIPFDHILPYSHATHPCSIWCEYNLPWGMPQQKYGIQLKLHHLAPDEIALLHDNRMDITGNAHGVNMTLGQQFCTSKKCSKFHTQSQDQMIKHVVLVSSSKRRMSHLLRLLSPTSILCLFDMI